MKGAAALVLARPPVMLEELASSVQRDRSTVSRDVQALASVGLLEAESVIHAGHGRSCSVRAAAQEVRVQFSL